MARPPFLSVAGATMRHDETTWTTDPAYGPGTTFAVGQGFGDAEAIRVDLYDDILNDRIAELRLFRLEEGTDTALGGVLRIAGRGVWPISCPAS